MACRPRLNSPAPEAPAARQAVDPGHRVGPVVAVLRDAEEAVEVGQAQRLRFEIARRRGLELDLDPGDDAGEPEAAHRGGEEVRPHVRPDLDRLAVAADEAKGTDVAAEGSGAVVVLAVDVVGDGAAERHELGARRHRHEPAAGHADGQERADRQSRLGPNHAGRPVGRHDAVEPAGAQQVAAVVEAHVAVGAPHAVGQRGTDAGPEGAGEVVEVGRLGHAAPRARHPAPGRGGGPERVGPDGAGHRRTTCAQTASSAQAAPSTTLVRSRAANRIGSSFINPRVVSIHMRRIQ